LLALLISATVPSVGTTVALVIWPDNPAAKGLFMAGKVWLLLVPLLWLKFVERQPIRMPKWSNRGMVAGHVTGLLIASAIFAAYLTVGQRWIDLDAMRSQIAAVGMDRVWLFIAFAVYLSFINSLLEEYFWRWFVDARLRDLLAGLRWLSPLVIVLGALWFTAHHIIALNVYFDAKTTALASFGVFMGGVIWSVLYRKYSNIYAAWVSHIWADLAIFAIGAWLIFGSG
jgi:membrane protease YdiL (CAAX protease family)